MRSISHSQTAIVGLSLTEQRLGCSGGVCSGLGRAGHCNWSDILTADTGRAQTKKEKRQEQRGNERKKRERARPDWDKGTGRVEGKMSSATQMKE